MPNGQYAIKVTIRRPTVVAGSFKAEDGSIGTVIVNTTSKRQQAKISLTPGAHSATLFNVDRVEEQHGERCPDEISVTLEPFGIGCLSSNRDKT